MRSLSIALYAAAILIIVLGIGRIIGLPIFLSIVATGSMAPSLQPLDMVVAVRKGYGQGDIVIWCSAPMYCVIHRVVDANSSVVITRGDANPVPDPPISPGLVRGVVVLVIPRLLWISLVLAPLIAYGVVLAYRRRFGIKIFLGGTALAYSIMILYTSFSAILMLTSPINPVLFDNLVIPSAELIGIDYNYSSGSIYASYSLRDMEIINITSCTMVLSNTTISCYPKLLVSLVEIEVPGEMLRQMNLGGINTLRVKLGMSLSKGASLETYFYTVYINPRPPVINVSGGIARIYNPNHFCLDTNITILWANAIGPWNTTNLSKCIDPLDRVELDLRGYRYSYIRIEYILSGKTMIEQKEVTRDGKPAG